MSIIQAIILGIVQGITEFLPVSSSGHLIFFPALFGWKDQGVAFDIAVHVGTLFAVIIYFRKKLWLLFRAFFSLDKSKKLERRLAWFLLLSVIPVGIVGVLVGNNSRSFVIIGWSFIVWGIVLAIADRYNKKLIKVQSNVQKISIWQVFIISISQILALIPGTSRSGITMTAGLFAKLDKKAAAEFSFLMSIPVILAAGFLSFLDYISEYSYLPEQYGSVWLHIIGGIAAFFSAIVAMWGLLKIVEKWSYLPFVIYRIIIGVAILLFLV